MVAWIQLCCCRFRNGVLMSDWAYCCFGCCDGYCLKVVKGRRTRYYGEKGEGAGIDIFIGDSCYLLWLAVNVVVVVVVVIVVIDVLLSLLLSFRSRVPSSLANWRRRGRQHSL